MKVRKKPIVVEAEQWFKHGDNSDVVLFDYNSSGVTHMPKFVCKHCGLGNLEHGYIKTLEGGHIVCPKDWIITGVAGEKYPCKPDIFEKTYDIL